MDKIKKNFSFLNLSSDGSFPIGGWVEPLPPSLVDGEDLLTEESYRKIKNGGFDFVCSIYSSFPDEADQVLRHLDDAEKADVKLFITDKTAQKGRLDENFEKNLEENRKRYASKRSFLGWLVKDEPGSKMFGDLKERCERLSKIDEKAELYVNLLPTYSPGFMLEDGYVVENAVWEKCDPIAYEKYVSDYLKQIKPKFLSYDFYPFDNGESGVSVLPDYFYQLSVAMRAAANEGIPCIPFVQACKFNKWSRNPTREERLWQINTTLAYGAKGIQYFTLWAPVNNDYENFEGYPIGAKGELGKEYADVKAFNAWIKKIGEKLKKLAFCGLYASGETPAPIQEIDLIQDDLVTLSGDAFVGAFQDEKERNALFVVCNKLKGQSEIALEVSEANSLLITTEKTQYQVGGNRFAATLNAGEGVLIEIL